MRRPLLIAALSLTLLFGQVTAHPVAARPLADPIAGSFIYPVGNPDLPPTWDPRNGNGYFITQGFNDSCDPSLDQGYYAYGLYYCGHTGIDLASEAADATVHATAAGVVTEAQQDGGYGVTVRIRHTMASGQIVYSQYEHMQYGSLEVYAGETVDRGQALGLVGATGFANGAHLHFELKTMDAGGPGYTFGNQEEIAPFFDPLAFVAAHALRPATLITATGHALPEFPAETDAVLTRFLAQYQHYVVVNVDHGLNIRYGPGTRYPVRGVALRGAKLGFLKAVGRWFYVALPQNVRGWVSSDWVAGYRAWDKPWPPRGPLAMVDSVGLNIHIKPGERHTVVGQGFAGDIVSTVSHTAHWTRIRTREGTNGWVLTRYLVNPGVLHARGGGSSIRAVASVLNVRSGPGLQYPLVGSIFKGTPLQLVRVSPHWAAVIMPGGSTGWVAREYTSLAHQATARTAARRQAIRARSGPAIYVRAHGSVVNIHSDPGERHPVVARAMSGTRLQVLGNTTHWLHVALPASSIEGWVLRRLTR